VPGVEAKGHGDALPVGFNDDRCHPGHAAGNADRQRSVAGMATRADGSKFAAVVAHVHALAGKIHFDLAWFDSSDGHFDVQWLQEEYRTRSDGKLETTTVSKCRRAGPLLQVTTRFRYARHIRSWQQQRREPLADDGRGKQRGNHRQIEPVRFGEFQAQRSPQWLMPLYNDLIHIDC